MKVLLTADLEKVGQLGDIIEVKNGYARNYLFPRKLAVEVSQHQLSIIESQKKKIQKKLELEKFSAIDQREKLENVVLTIRKKAGENDVLFGSVTPSEIEEEFAKLGVKIERKKIHLEEPIKRIGNYTCKIKLFKDVEAQVKIEVIGEGDAAKE